MSRMKYLNRHTAALAAVLVLAAAGTAHAVMSVTVGGMEVQFREDLAWCVSDVFRNDDLITGSPTVNAAVAGCWSVQDAYVPLYGDMWIGGGHGCETVLEAGLTVDGLVQPLADGAGYSGSEAVIRRTTNVGDLYLLESTLTLTPDHMTESIRMTGMSSPVKIATFYAMLSSHPNRFDEFAAFDETGLAVDYTETRAGYMWHYFFEDEARCLALYDEGGEEGVRLSWSIPGDVEQEAFLVDRFYDNKLYLKFVGEGRPVEPGRSIDMEFRTAFFNAPPDDWQDAAWQSIPEPATLGLLALAGAGLVSRRRRR